MYLIHLSVVTHNIIYYQILTTRSEGIVSNIGGDFGYTTD